MKSLSFVSFAGIDKNDNREKREGEIMTDIRIFFCMSIERYARL